MVRVLNSFLWCHLFGKPDGLHPLRLPEELASIAPAPPT